MWIIKNTLSYSFTLSIFVLLSFVVISGAEAPPTVTPSSSSDNEGCNLNGYEAHCILNILDEHIEATAIVNHCSIPLDITFRVIYRYSNGTDRRWQYTFVTTNQNVRVPIPGLTLPPEPDALVYLYVRVPQPLFDLQNGSLAAVEASFVATLSNNEWEEIEFLNEEVMIDTRNDCNRKMMATYPLLYILGGSILGLLIFSCLVILFIWCYRKRKLALDELALVASLETGLPGAQPYQIGADLENQRNNNLFNDKQKNVNSKPNGVNESSKSFPQAFKFGRLREESIDEKHEKAVQKLNDAAVVIGNPVLLKKARPNFNKMASSPESNDSSTRIACVGDSFENFNSVNKFERDGTVSRSFIKSKESEKQKQKKSWNSHPLEPSEDDSTPVDDNPHNGARPKQQKIKLNTSEENSS